MTDSDQIAAGKESTETDLPATHDAAAEEVRQFVSFSVGDEEYAVDIMQVREIKGWTEVTVLPNQPEYMRGVLNLRGLIVPIIDLRCRFDGKRTDASATHVVVIVAIGNRIVGVLVDRVSDILTVNVSQIRDVPDMEARADQEFLMGLVTAHERLVAILAIDKLVNFRVLSESVSAAAA